MKLTNLFGLAAVGIENAAKIGKIEDALVDLQNRQVVAFEVKGVDNRTTTTITAAQVKNIGADALTFHSQGEPLSDGAAHTAGRSSLVNTLGTIGFSKLANHYKVVTDAGKLLGVIKDIEFDPNTLAIIGFETTEGGLFAKHHIVQADPTINFGESMAIVPEQLLPTH